MTPSTAAVKTCAILEEDIFTDQKEEEIWVDCVNDGILKPEKKILPVTEVKLVMMMMLEEENTR
jgi:hypothetical protein